MLSIENNILIHNNQQVILNDETPAKVLNAKYVITKENHIYEIVEGLRGSEAIRILANYDIMCAFAFDKYNIDTIIIQNANGDVHIIKHNFNHMHQIRNISQKIISADIYKNVFVKLETKDYYYSVVFEKYQVIWEQLPKLMHD